MGATSDAVATRAAARMDWVAVPVVIAIASRLFSVILLLARGPDKSLPLLVGDNSPFVAWDGQWYLHIAQFGYHAEAIQPALNVGGHHDFAFYPLWPLVIWLASLGGLLPMNATAVVLANVLFVLAAIGVYRLFIDRFGEWVALGGLLLLCFNPVAYVFTMAYTESLFLLLAGLFFVNRYGRLSPLLAGLSVLVRVSGLAIGAASVATMLVGRNHRRMAFVCAVAVAAAFTAWWVFIWRLTGEFTGWLDGSAAWSRQQGIPGVLAALRHRPLGAVIWGGFVLLMIGSSLLLLRRHPDLAVYCLVMIGISLVGSPPSSMARHTMIAFPAFAALAGRLGPRLTGVLTVAFAIGQIVFIQLSFGPGHRPP